MNDIYWIYIIDRAGATIFSYENYVQGTNDSGQALLSHFIFALQAVAKNLENDEIKKIEIGNNKFFLTKEKFTGYLFILKTDRDANSDIVLPILKVIKEKFVERFSGYFELNVDDKIELLNSFKNDIKGILRPKSSLGEFLGAVREE